MLALLLFACAKPVVPQASLQLSTDSGLSAELVNAGSLSERIAGADQADWVVFYTGEQRADLAPCGCADTPRGGLARTAAYLDASGDGVVVNGAGWLDEGQSLDGSPMADAKLKNEWMIRGLNQLNVDAVHVGFGDLIALARMNEPPPLPLVSANLQGPGIHSHLIVDHHGHRIGISGISHPGHISIATPGYTRTDPLEAAQVVITQLAAETDFVVLLNNNATAATKKLLKGGQVDVVIETAKHRGFELPFRQSGAIWVRSYDQGLRLGELRLRTSEKHGLTAHDRKIDLDSSMPSQAEMTSLANDAERELKALDKALFSP